jgi:hypothetical protein
MLIDVRELISSEYDKYKQGKGIMRAGSIQGELCKRLLYFVAYLLFLSTGPSASAEKTSASTHLSLTIVFEEPIYDGDGDAIPDAWEMSYFGNLDIADDSTDFDADGFLDCAEYIAGTDPRDPDSALQFTVMRRLPNGLMQLTWATSTNTFPGPRLYSLYLASGICDFGTNKIVLGQDIPCGGSPFITIYNVPPLMEPCQFFGVDVRIDH